MKNLYFGFVLLCASLVQQSDIQAMLKIVPFGMGQSKDIELPAYHFKFSCSLRNVILSSGEENEALSIKRFVISQDGKLIAIYEELSRSIYIFSIQSNSLVFLNRLDVSKFDSIENMIFSLDGMVLVVVAPQKTQTYPDGNTPLGLFEAYCISTGNRDGSLYIMHNLRSSHIALTENEMYVQEGNGQVIIKKKMSLDRMSCERNQVLPSYISNGSDRLFSRDELFAFQTYPGVIEDLWIIDYSKSTIIQRGRRLSFQEKIKAIAVSPDEQTSLLVVHTMDNMLYFYERKRTIV